MFKHISHRFTIVILVFVFLFSLQLPSFQSTSVQAATGLSLDVKSAILVEASSGKVLYKLNEDIPLPPASMTKMMTELLVWEAVDQGKITWDQKVKTSEYGFFHASIKDSSKVFLNMGEERTVKELYEAMAIYSANDATVMLAETIAGTEENFVKMMNKKAEELGMENTHFLTSTGFPADELGEYRPNISGEHYMSARDTAILARELVTKYPEMLETSSIPRAQFREGESNPIDMINWNWMLSGLWHEYEGVDGLKTGHTEEAKYCFTGTAERNGIRFITVVMGAESIESRFEQTRKLLDYAFANYALHSLVDKGSLVEGSESVPVLKGKLETIKAVTDQSLIVPVKRGEEDLYQLESVFHEVTAPLEKGAVVGQVTYKYSGEESNEFLRPQDAEAFQVQLVADESVEKANWIRLAFRGIKNFFGNIFGGIADAVKNLF